MTELKVQRQMLKTRVVLCILYLVYSAIKRNMKNQSQQPVKLMIFLATRIEESPSELTYSHLPIARRRTRKADMIRYLCVFPAL